VAIVVLLAFPVTPTSAYIFASVFGFTWLATVPLTNGVVAGMFGVKHLATLTGFVYLSHQVGSFVGGWMGGYIYDTTGSYQLVWTCHRARGGRGAGEPADR
jgi:predicted MFS family arabinose efflux permease